MLCVVESVADESEQVKIAGPFEHAAYVLAAQFALKLLIGSEHCRHF